MNDCATPELDSLILEKLVRSTRSVVRTGLFCFAFLASVGDETAELLTCCRGAEAEVGSSWSNAMLKEKQYCFPDDGMFATPIFVPSRQVPEEKPKKILK